MENVLYPSYFPTHGLDNYNLRNPNFAYGNTTSNHHSYDTFHTARLPLPPLTPSPIIPTRLEDYSAYLASSCFSRTERRLVLDGIEQVATDLQIS